MDTYDIGATLFDRHGELAGLSTVRELAFRASPVAQIVVTGDDTVAMINQQAETTFGLSARDIGRLLRDLEVSYRPVELRAYLEQAKVERRSARIQDVQWQRPGAEAVWFEIHVNPLVDAENGLLGVSIVFFDVTRPGRCWTRSSRPTVSSRPPTRNCSRRTKNSRPPTKSCSRQWKSWKPPTKNCSPPTKSSRR